MTTPLDNPKVTAALERAGMSSPSPDVIDRLTFACNLADGPDPDEILEISQADWANEDQGTDVVVIQTRDGVLLVGKGKRGRFKPMETFAIRGPYNYYQISRKTTRWPERRLSFSPKTGISRSCSASQTPASDTGCSAAYRSARGSFLSMGTAARPDELHIGLRPLLQGDPNQRTLRVDGAVRMGAGAVRRARSQQRAWVCMGLA